jgi:superfamily I DNA/RNA helicase
MYETSALAENLDRLLALYGTDEGFYTLALFAWIEAFAGTVRSDIEGYEHFSDKIKALLSALSSSDQPLYYPRYGKLMQGYQTANRVRHYFEKLSKGEAVAMTNEFICFCEFVDWHNPKLDTLRQQLSLWDNKMQPAEAQKELILLRNKLASLQDDNEVLRQSLADSSLSYDELQAAKKKLLTQTEALDKAEAAAKSRQLKNDQLRCDLHALKEQKKNLEKEFAKIRFQEDYLSYLERFTFYTRSRNDYERNLMQLTPEQLAASRRIRERGDYLIRGSAGTGKTLVLLHALLNNEKKEKETLGFDCPGEVYLLTYTKTLVRFNTYLSCLLARRDPEVVVTTVDQFLLERLRMADDQYCIDYQIIENFIRDLIHGASIQEGALQEGALQDRRLQDGGLQNRGVSAESLSFLTEKELIAEIETAIFGRALTREAYCNSPGARIGMKRALSKLQKELVWEAAEEAARSMLASRAFSKNYSRLMLLRELKSRPELIGALRVRRLYIDEVQDLSPVDIKLLSLLSEDGLVMAGDEAQSIYQTGFSFRKLDVKIIGHSSTLLLNYRNTRQIDQLARMYAHGTPSDVPSDVPSGNGSGNGAAGAFRDGPVPELWLEDSAEALRSVLINRLRFFIDTLRYSPENLAVLGPTKLIVGSLQQELQRVGLDTVDIRSSNFDFEGTPGIRLSTLHSAKGVEFPVVMLFIPELPVSSRISREAAEASCRNLVYVAMTRCIDNLQIFSLKEPEQAVTSEFCDVYHAYSAQVHAGG